ncbi:hypothetical protein N8348_03150 [Litorivicinus sp.]|nr:hypothetical protein [Litorivicinus sp.]
MLGTVARPDRVDHADRTVDPVVVRDRDEVFRGRLELVGYCHQGALV